MLTRRIGVGVAVLNRLLYAVGGFDGTARLRSAECYHPERDAWRAIAPMASIRSGAGLGAPKSAAPAPTRRGEAPRRGALAPIRRAKEEEGRRSPNHLLRFVCINYLPLMKPEVPLARKSEAPRAPAALLRAPAVDSQVVCSPPQKTKFLPAAGNSQTRRQMAPGGGGDGERDPPLCQHPRGTAPRFRVGDPPVGARGRFRSERLRPKRVGGSRGGSRAPRDAGLQVFWGWGTGDGVPHPQSLAGVPTAPRHRRRRGGRRRPAPCGPAVARTYRLPVPGAPWEEEQEEEEEEEGQDMRDLRSPGRSPVSTASARSMGRGGGRSVSEKPRCRMRMGVRGWRQRCWGGFNVAGPSRGTGNDSERLFRAPAAPSIPPAPGRTGGGGGS
uniref:Uncharacterized protein n=1 Tax=Cairina moschata TaxID=8855 RepID=A0A8C3CI92_CAIMO